MQTNLNDEVHQKTSCQIPIDGFEIALSTTITVQKADWVDVSHAYIRTDEEFTILFSVTQGHPVYYRVDWETDNVTDASHNDTSGLKKYPYLLFSK